MNGIPCRPCKCPTAERNYAGYKIDNINHYEKIFLCVVITCSVRRIHDFRYLFLVTCSADRSHTEFSCQCRAGYTGPKCDRCDYGYYGLNIRNLMSRDNDEDGCTSCKCNVYGSLTDQCDQLTGQCFCVDEGVTGRDCSECQVI